MLGEKKKAYQIILEKEIKEKIDELAKKDDRSTSSYINKVLKEHIKNLEFDKK